MGATITELALYAAPSYLARRGVPRRIGDLGEQTVSFIEPGLAPCPGGSTARAVRCNRVSLLRDHLVRELGARLASPFRAG
jgi:hypothetical protein